MLTIITQGREYFDDSQRVTKRYNDGKVIELEDSLYSRARWEEEFKRPFGTTEMLGEEVYRYIQLMVTNGVRLEYNDLTSEDLESINEYISQKHTATTITRPPSSGGTGGGKVITTEQMYAAMCIGQVPWEAQYWNITRLQTLLDVIHEMTSEKKKKTRSEILRENAELNAQRRRELNTKG